MNSTSQLQMPSKGCFLFTLSESICINRNCHIYLYARPLDKLPGYIYTNNVPRTLATWQSQVNQDLTSKLSQVVVSDTSCIRLEYNATSTSKTVLLDSAYVGIDSTVYLNTVTLPPYSSLALLRVPSFLILPKMLISMGRSGNKVALKWKTSNETAISFFEVQSHRTVCGYKYWQVNVANQGFLDR